MKRSFLITLLVGLVACNDSEVGRVPPDLEQALASIDAGLLAEHVRALDEGGRESRPTGSPGHTLAVQYVADQLRTFGLRSLPGEADLVAEVPLVQASAPADRTSIRIHSNGSRQSLVAGRDVVPLPDFVREASEVRAQLVWVGFGVSSPEHSHDDYAAVDVSDRVVVLADGAPTGLPPEARLHHGAETTKWLQAVRNGAVGALLVAPRAPGAEATSEAAEIPGTARPQMTWIARDGIPHGAYSELFLRARLTPLGARALFDGSARSFDDVLGGLEGPSSTSFATGLEIEAHVESDQRSLSSDNVVGVLPGSDPALADECVVVAVRLDTPSATQVAPNSAAAWALASFLEVARGAALLEQPPRRSLLFLAATGGEQGALGVDFVLDRAESLGLAVVAAVLSEPWAGERPSGGVAVTGHSRWWDEPRSWVCSGPARACSEAAGDSRKALVPITEEQVFAGRGIPCARLAPVQAATEEISSTTVANGNPPASARRLAPEFGAELARLQLWLAWAAAERDPPPPP